MARIGERIICQKDAFLCAALGTKVSIAFNKRLGAGFFGGEGFILQKLEGDGMAFLHAGGTIVKKQLNLTKSKIKNKKRKQSLKDLTSSLRPNIDKSSQIRYLD